ncbi:ArnT family glycosyltransferase [Cyclobacterium jeungdonense]|uniref:Phospholipid carrier-dependent glycosyltransferase n=1 Tax=Cyclobacterium jeungdonense TaxID=708087 RepID=A0ABT8C875_9BACT|nr:phospholipid carrier-dependent glycosyltransferase [Cyclobacterium jeungdonense]MDN3688272.1 phospholipid carrier-dependent glycosyltransferase [Cyclobacterium jeungdonense]
MELPRRWIEGYQLPLAAFLLLIAPFALDFHLHYPDEMYYTDAAIQMMQNGDYLTTYLGNGELRFKKPILTYWAVLAGFKTLGVSALSSRLLFLIAGAALIPLVYRIVSLISSNSRLPQWSAWIVATHPIVIFSSTRSIPDILLVFFMTFAALGVAGLIHNGKKAPKKYLWLFYLSLGLAFEVKGLPAAALGLIAVAYLRFNPWQPLSLKQLLYPPALLSGVAIGLFWFVAMYFKFGPVYLDSFFEDQLGMRVGSRLLQIIRHLSLALLLMLVLFVPWFIPAIKNVKKNTIAVFHENKVFFGFVALWVVSIIAMTGLVSTFYERYLLPVTPVAAIGLAGILLKRQPEALNTSLNVAAWAFLGINWLLLAVALLPIIGLENPPLIYIQWVAGLSLSLFLAFKLAIPAYRLQVLGTSVLLVFFNLSLLSHPLSIPHQGVQVRRHLEQQSIPENSQIAFLGHPHYASKIRIGLGTAYTLKTFKKLAEVPEQFRYLICDGAHLKDLPDGAFSSDLASLNWDPKYWQEMVTAIFSGETNAAKRQWGKKYYWVERLAP